MTTITKSTMLVVALTLLASASTSAQVIRGRVVVVPRGPVFYTPFYSPFYSPFWHDPFWWGPYYAGRPSATLALKVTPKEAKETQVYVDGYAAGRVADHSRLPVTPGGHAITFFLEGYRTVTEDIYAQPGKTSKLTEAMVALPTGEASAPPPAPEPHHSR